MLILRTDIPHGNAALAALRLEDGIPVVHFAADPHGGTESLWWCLRLERTGAPAPAVLRLAWEHLRNCLGLAGADAVSRLHPVARADDGPWRRLAAGERRDGADGSFAAAWELPMPVRWLECAFCFPHGAGDVDALAHRTGWRRDVIGVSAKGRELVRLANRYGEPGAQEPGLYCIAHQHASEMSGAWTLHGFLEAMAAAGSDAPVVWSVPVTNVDGVIEGDYGKDPFPWDLNRAWGRPAMRPEVHAVMRDMDTWKSRCKPLLCIDFHSPGGGESDGVYTFLPNPETDADAHSRCLPWAEAIAAALGAYGASRFGRVATYPGRFGTDQHGTFTRFHNRAGLTALTFEVPYHRIGARILEIADYLEIGARMAAAVCQALAAKG